MGRPRSTFSANDGTPAQASFPNAGACQALVYGARQHSIPTSKVLCVFPLLRETPDKIRKVFVVWGEARVLDVGDRRIQIALLGP